MTSKLRQFGLPVAFAMGLCTAVQAQVLDSAAELIRVRIENLPDAPLVDDVHVASERVLELLYRRQSFEPLWKSRDNIEAFVGLVSRAEEQGLLPRDYHAPKLARMIETLNRESGDLRRRVDLDLLLTHSLLRYVYHLRFGKVDPASLDAKWNFTRQLPDPDVIDRLLAFIDNPRPPLQQIIPQTPDYGRLQEALARYRAIAQSGGWPAVPPGPTLKREMSDPRVGLLRERLRVTGELDAPAGEPNHFDETLKQAVISFQRGHGLQADGAVGAQTLAALNVPVESRIDQLRVNLERTRWVFQDIGDNYVLVNIAGFRVTFVLDGRPVWTTRAVVGRPYRKTPVFRSKITYLVFNPTWTVPPTILREDLLPKLRADPGLLGRQNMTLRDSRDRAVDPGSIDWGSVSFRDFPYAVRQAPGPDNALGQVKFMFPNAYSIYLHDTPSRDLFSKPDRTFSSGCIRVEHAEKLASLLLDDPARWSGEKIAAEIANGKTRTVLLSRPVAVLLLYWTVEIDDEGKPVFLKDIYRRDAAVLAALNGPFVFSPPAGYDSISE